MVSAQTICEVLAGTQSMQEKVETLLNLALENGGKDNITIVLLSARSAPPRKVRKRKFPTLAVLIATVVLLAAIAVGDLTPEECAAAYLRRGVVVCDRSKHSMYSNRIVTALGLNGCVRVSPMHCHGAADIDRFLRVTAEIAKEATR